MSINDLMRCTKTIRKMMAIGQAEIDGDHIGDELHKLVNKANNTEPFRKSSSDQIIKELFQEMDEGAIKYLIDTYNKK
jgi:hypothetical protein